MTADRHDRYRRNYAPVFLRYLAERDEGGLRTAYELGRRAMLEELSMLDLVQIHHAVLLEVLRTLKDPEELDGIAEAASEFLVEVLATFEMIQRSFVELRGSTAHRRRDQGQRPEA